MTGRRRPVVDASLPKMLRRRIDHGLSGLAPPAQAERSSCAHTPLVVTKARLRRALACARHSSLEEPLGPSPTAALARGVLVDACFRQLVTTGSVADPMADGLAALRADGRQDDLLAWIADLPDERWSELVAEVDAHVGQLRRCWPRLDPAWMPRTQEPMRVRVADGRVELAARVDLALGMPGQRTASVALVEVKSGPLLPEHVADLHWSALVEALRHPAPPFAVGLYSTCTGAIDVDWVTADLLVAAADRMVAGVRRLLSEGTGGRDPAPRESRWCDRCRSGEAGPVDSGRVAAPTALSQETDPW
jgi:hypothetical protein